MNVKSLSCLVLGCALVLGCGLFPLPVRAEGSESAQADMPLAPTFVSPADSQDAKADARVAATPEQQQEVNAVLRGLYDAFVARDVDKTMKILHCFVEKSAADYAAEHPWDSQALDKIRDAYLAYHQDIYANEDFNPDPFTLEFADYFVYKDGSLEVVSSVPIISSASMSFEDNEGNGYIVRPRLGRFLLRKIEGQWQITEMDLF